MRLLFVVKDLRLSAVYEFSSETSVPPCRAHLDVLSSLKAKHRTLSQVSDPAPPGEAEVPDPPQSLFLTNGTLLLSFPWLMRDPHAFRLPAPYHLQFREALIPDCKWYDIQSGPFDGSDMSSVVSDERLASLEKLSFSISALLARDKRSGAPVTRITCFGLHCGGDAPVFGKSIHSGHACEHDANSSPNAIILSAKEPFAVVTV